jgi:hypothetical protein
MDIDCIDDQQKIVVGLKVQRPCIGRRGNKVDRPGIFRVGDIHNSHAIAEHVTYVGMSFVDHDLHTIAAISLIRVANEFDVFAWKVL